MTLLFFCIFLNFAFSQNTPIPLPNYTPEQEEAAKKWIDNLYEIGFDVKGDSVSVSEEVKLLASDKAYYQLVYPAEYTWEYTLALMKKSALKPAFWHMINIYYKQPKYKDLVLQTIIPYDQIFQMEKILVSSYYTYAPYDPEVSHMINGERKFARPDIAEAKLMAVKEIVDHVLYYRQKRMAKE